MFRSLLLLFLLLSLPGMLRADDAAGLAFFEQKVRPVLVKHCYSCHSAEAKKLRGNLLLDSQAGWRRGGDSGEPVIVPGQPEKSLLIQSIRHEGDYAMPPKEKLPANIVADLTAWVKMGAPDPRTGAKLDAKRADKSWWSLQPLRSAPPPEVRDPLWQANPIDRWISARLQDRGLTPSPPADARTLIRRMSYDVIGLPPTMAEVQAFESAYAADAESAVRALVDRLLASPHYGEQWGRHWLDVVRYGESNGFERNVIINDLWPFRDYVIRSINEDKPFDRFMQEHLAGDQIGPGNPEVEVGTAFLVAGPYDDVGNQDPVAQANIRAATLDDLITATGSAFLGLTVNCARCHHHKFDPIPTEDYYRLRAAFEGVTHGRRVLATPEERHQFTARTQPLQQELGRLEAERRRLDQDLVARIQEEHKRRTYRRPKIDPQRTEETFRPVEARYVRMVIHANTAHARSGSEGNGRLTEFEVWTAGASSRNVALASAGGKAEGARSAFAEDFPEAYGPQYVIDNQNNEQWFIGRPAVLTITLAQPETIDRIAFSNIKGKTTFEKAQGATPCEYDISVSLDGQTWTNVANGDDREPWSPAHGVERLRRQLTTPEETAQLAELDRQIAAVQAEQAKIPPLRQVWAGNFQQPRAATHVHKGGDPMKPGEAVVASSLNVLELTTKPYALPVDAAEGERRLALARWITARDNPLTPRVLTNRVWHYHFGTGLVDTPSDFGFLGSQPTHPELLDWLAQRLIEHGWRLKPLHREILLSRTYRQSSADRPDAAAVDKEARLLWRFPPRRLKAEELRDTLLSVAGQLDRRAGGPGFRLYKFTQNNVCTYTPLDVHGPETYRRAVYHQNARASVVDLLTDFDLPDNAFAAPKRSATTSPMQALVLLNHAFTLDMAAALARQVEREAGSATPPALVEALFRRVLQRQPRATEQEAAERLLAAHGLPALCRGLLNCNELLFLE